MIEPSDVLPRLTDYLDRHADHVPEQDAVVFEGQHVTYRELKAQVDRCAKALLAAGLRHGDRVAMLCTSRPEFWILFLATARVGGIWVGLNPRYQEAECAYVLDDVKPRLLFAVSQFDARDHRPWLAAARERFPSLRRIVAIGAAFAEAQPFDEFIEEGGGVSAQRLERATRAVSTDDPLTMIYTSGSTGQPKGAVLTHHGLCFGGTVQHAQLGVRRPKLVVNFPINHIACVGDCCAMTLVGGGTIVFQERFEPVAMLEATERERCTILGGVPTMLQLLLGALKADHYDLSSVELVVWGGAALPVPVIQELSKLGTRLLTVYGLTETAANVCFTPAGASLEVLAHTIGRPAPEFPCRIVNPAGAVCAPGQPGEIQFAGRYLMKEYWGRPQATLEAFTTDGWLRTGDIGVWRDDGTIELVGRSKEMFKSGGFNVYPREIEAVLEAHAEVEMAAVISVPDALYQEVGWAYVVPGAPRAGLAESLREHCRTQLANYKVPKRIFLRTELPALPIGKVDKVTLRKQAHAQLDAALVDIEPEAESR